MQKKPISTYTIRDIGTLRVITDSLRIQILELMIQEPQTVNQVADKLGLAPSKLYYHVNLLEKHGLIQVAETRTVANIIEKVYRAVARNIDIDPSLFTFRTEEGKEAFNSTITPILDTTREDLLRSLQARAFQLDQGAEEHPRGVIVTRDISHLSEKRVKEFMERLTKLQNEFYEADQGAPSLESPNYALTLVFYPTFYFKQSEKEAQE